MRLFRTVDSLELADIRRSGKLRALPHLMPGKHVAVKQEDAATWGRLFYLGEPHAIITLEVPEVVLTGAEHWSRLDAIGPAYFIVADDLELVKIVRVDEIT